MSLHDAPQERDEFASPDGACVAFSVGLQGTHGTDRSNRLQKSPPQTFPGLTHSATFQRPVMESHWSHRMTMLSFRICVVVW